MSSIKKLITGGCYYERSSPARQNINANTDILNLHLDLEQALRLELALSECIRKVNRYKENSIAGKRAIVNISVHLWCERITANEGKLSKRTKKKKNKGTAV